MADLSPEVLLRRLEVLYAKAKRGDAATRALILRTKQQAKAGDRRAAIVYNTLASLHWRAQSAPEWSKLQSFYVLLGANDPEAWKAMRRIKELAERGNEQACRTFATLKAIHHEKKLSVWYPGAPKIGGYPMPNKHRAGIEIPGMVPGLPGLSIPGIPNIPGLALPGPQAPYIGPGIQPGRFLPLTPAAATNLMAVIARALMSVPAGGFELSSNPMEQPPVDLSPAPAASVAPVRVATDRKGVATATTSTAAASRARMIGDLLAPAALRGTMR